VLVHCEPNPNLKPNPQGFEKTGLGDRVATLFVRAFGKSTLGLAYGLSVAEALVAPAMPSTTARAGGIFMPIISSLALANGSKPGLLCVPQLPCRREAAAILHMSEKRHTVGIRESCSHRRGGSQGRRLDPTDSSTSDSPLAGFPKPSLALIAHKRNKVGLAPMQAMLRRRSWARTWSCRSSRAASTAAPCS